MEEVFSIVDQLGRFIGRHLYGVSLAAITTLVAIYGADINQVVRVRIQRFNLMTRTAIFVAVCAFGYGWLIVNLTPMLRRFLNLTPRVWLPLVVISMFLCLGLLAQGKRKI